MSSIFRESSIRSTDIKGVSALLGDGSIYSLIFLFQFFPIEIPGIGFASGSDVAVADDILDRIFLFERSDETVNRSVLCVRKLRIHFIDHLDTDGKII